MHIARTTLSSRSTRSFMGKAWYHASAQGQVRRSGVHRPVVRLQHWLQPQQRSFPILNFRVIVRNEATNKTLNTNTETCMLHPPRLQHLQQESSVLWPEKAVSQIYSPLPPERVQADSQPERSGAGFKTWSRSESAIQTGTRVLASYFQ